MAVAVLGIAGSARRDGNSGLLLDRALAGAADAGAATEKVALVDMALHPCVCPTSEDCLPAGVCSVQDDMQALYPRLLACDLLYVASPIFFRNVTAQLKMMIDRCQAVWVRKYKLEQDITPGRQAKRKGLFIAVANDAGEREFQAAIITMRSVFATLNVRYAADLLVGGLERPGDALQRRDYQARAYELGVRLVREELASQAKDA
ncbi:MAG: flavodoxin family protein [Chloroflexota bacterium]|nr:flavodoxin family protein [Chloroflexota bacterium]